MDTKLTLRLDERVIELAKQYARKRGTSLSKLIENFLGAITSNPPGKDEISPLVRSLSGVVDCCTDHDDAEESHHSEEETST